MSDQGTQTPEKGPWEADATMAGNVGVEAAYAVRDSDGFVVASVWADCEHLKPHAKANAHLIAASPEMYSALQYVLQNCGDPIMENVAKAALLKAESR